VGVGVSVALAGGFRVGGRVRRSAAEKTDFRALCGRLGAF